ncbi:N-acylneuraminate-9-phosphatase isoform X1 [Schistocerca americana]|uniref:N-acylneuraminate-9-phosphatase isoform X1 n=1 Tax=Schistocerca americana TaxID=7009 RepID=UPI001F4F51DC|nr:N-acylneuraminate-9-phosphatase isoform X1 [Schistocerca americana]
MLLRVLYSCARNIIHSMRTNIKDVSIRTRKVSAILFDLDNTLITTRKSDQLTCEKVSEYLQEEYDVPKSKAEAYTRIFLKNFQSCPENSDMSLDQWRLFLWTQALGSTYTHISDNVYRMWLQLRMTYLLPGAEIWALLHKLQSQYHLGLITNGTSRAQWEKIQGLGLQNCFDCILVSGDLPWEKPQKAIFLEACKQLQTEPEHCLMVGDKLETDICGAMLADIGTTVWVPLTGQEELDPRPDFILNSILELPEALHMLSGSKAFSYSHRSVPSPDIKSESSNVCNSLS